MPDPSQMTEEDIDAFFGADPARKVSPIPGEPSAPVKTSAPTVSIGDPFFKPEPEFSPEFQRAFSTRSKGQFELQLDAMSPEERFVFENKQSNPLDIESGAGNFIRTQLSLRRTPEDKLDFLNRKFGVGNVRQSKDGSDFIVTTIGKDNKPVDVKVDEFGFDPIGEAADLTEVIPLTVGAIKGLKKGRISPGLRRLAGKAGAIRDIFTSAAGAGVAGAGVDVLSRVTPGSGVDVDPVEILQERGKLATADVIVGGALGVGAKVFNRAVSPFGGSRGPVQINMEAAADRLFNETGERIPFTFGEETGSPLAQKAEALFGQLPGGSKPLLAQKAASLKGLASVQRILAGGERAASEPSAVVGKEVLDVLGAKAEGLQEAVELSRRSTVKEATEDVIATLGQPGAIPASGHALGNAVRDAAVQARNAYRAQRDDLYAEAERLAGGDVPLLVPKSIKSEAKAMLEKFPKFAGKETPNPQVVRNLQAKSDIEALEAEKRDLIKKLLDNPAAPDPATTTKLQSVTDQIFELRKVVDEPITGPVATRKGKKLMGAFVNPRVVSQLRQLIAKGDEPWTFAELSSAKQNVDEMIQGGKAISGVKDRQMVRVSKLLGDAMKEGLDSLGDGGAARDAFNAAQEFVSKNRGIFDEAGPDELFKDKFRPNAFFKRLTNEGGTDEYLNLRTLLGGGSPEMEAIRQGMRNHLLQTGMSVTEEALDASRILSALNSMRRFSPEVAKDVLGNNFAQLQVASDLIKIKPGAKIATKDLETILTSPNLGSRVVPELKRLIKKQKALDEEFSSGLMSKIAKGLPEGVEGLRPEDIVNKVLPNASFTDLQKVIAEVGKDRDLLQRLQKKTIEDVFIKSRKSSGGQAILGGDPGELISAEKMQGLVKNADSRRKLEMVLGPENMANLDDLLIVLEGKQTTLTTGAGGIAGSMATAGFVRKGILSSLSDMIKFKVVATMMTSPILKRYARNGLITPKNQDTIFTSFLLSAPFIEELTDDVGVGAARKIAGALHDSIAQWVRDNPEVAEDDDSPQAPTKPVPVTTGKGQ